MTRFLSNKIKALSFFLIILVVFIHAYVFNKSPLEQLKETYKISWAVQLFFSYGIGRTAVPLFFLISSYLLFIGFPGNYFVKVKKRVKTLLIPYLITSAGIAVLYYCLQLLPQLRSFFGSGVIVNLPFHKLLDIVFLNPIPYQLWFLKDLMILVLLSPFFYYLSKWLKVFVLILPFISWLFEWKLYILRNDSVLFFTVGAYLVANNFTLPDSPKFLKKLAFVICLIWFILILMWAFLSIRNIMPSINLIFYKINILTGLLAIWVTYDRLLEQKDISDSQFLKLGTFSFFVYLVHEPVLTLIKQGLFKFIGISDFKILLIYFTSVILTTVFAVILAIALRKILPSTYYFLTGGR